MLLKSASLNLCSVRYGLIFTNSLFKKYVFKSYYLLITLQMKLDTVSSVEVE
jgi:hypothetical protein